MKTEVKIEICRDNRIEFTLEPSGMHAVAALYPFHDDYKALDIVGFGYRGKCDRSMFPLEPNQSVWVVTTGFNGCFWSYDLKSIIDYFEKLEFEEREGME